MYDLGTQHLVDVYRRVGNDLGCMYILVETGSTKMSWNDSEDGSSESERTFQAIGCCTTIMRQLTQRFQLENFWGRKTFPPFHILPTVQI
jgi:hypothetical protein